MHRSFWQVSFRTIIVFTFAVALALIGTSAIVHPVLAGTPTGLVIVSSSNPSYFGQNVTFTATFNLCPQNQAPIQRQPKNGGSISFYDGNTLLATVPDIQLDQCTVQANFSTAVLAVGTHHINAAYFELQTALDQVVTGPKDVPEGDTLLLLGGGLSGVGVWLHYQWNKRRNKK